MDAKDAKVSRQKAARWFDDMKPPRKQQEHDE